jgi:hypothetical protein
VNLRLADSQLAADQAGLFQMVNPATIVQKDNSTQ